MPTWKYLIVRLDDTEPNREYFLQKQAVVVKQTILLVNTVKILLSWINMKNLLRQFLDIKL